ncbi:CHASE2 domain-containing protein [Stappia sediminis]|uniref:CHASE2 domain-containing protein n=1 Tax=Stappia sediminis TaxID=2692190 RepID=UPI001369BFDC|nr:adenylate/guanylate cyclase domain-containing protein [Stappia sediminis]
MTLLSLVPVLIAALLIAWWYPGGAGSALSGVEGRLLDLRYHIRGPLPPGQDVVIVAIDDATIDRLNRFPIPREAIARAVDAVSRAGAGAIAVDLLLLQPGEGSAAQGDAALASALERAGAALLAMTGMWGEGGGGNPLADVDAPARQALSRSAFDVVVSGGGQDMALPSRLLLPLDEFFANARLGHVNIAGESDGALRRMPLALDVGDDLVLPALPLAAARAYAGLGRGEMRYERPGEVFFGERRVATDRFGALAVNFRGPAGTVPAHSLIDVIENKVPAEAFEGKLVFIGATGLGTGDTFATPFSEALPGVEVLASVAGNILTGAELRRDGLARALDLFFAVLGAALAFVAANRANLAAASVATLAVWSAAAALIQFAFTLGNIWIDATTVFLALAVSTFGTFFARIFLQKRISNRLVFERDNLARYHSPFLAESLARAEKPSFDDRAQAAAVVFVDVAGFTSLSEALGPAGTVGFLRRIHRVFEACALDCGGVIEQFMGDGAMIVFGLPEPGPADSVAALKCARELLDGLQGFNAAGEGEEPLPVRIRVSVHFGDVVAAVLGGSTQGHATVAGDTVNVSSRLQEIAKEHTAALIVSDAVRKAVIEAGRDDLLSGLQPLPGLAVRGRQGLIDVWVSGA